MPFPHPFLECVSVQGRVVDTEGVESFGLLLETAECDVVGGSFEVFLAGHCVFGEDAACLVDFCEVATELGDVEGDFGFDYDVTVVVEFLNNVVSRSYF